MIKNDLEYWKEFYKANSMPFTPSPFANFVLKYLQKNKYLLELGCGNGRDCKFFTENDIKVLGVDQVRTEIDFLNENLGNDGLKFISDDFTNLIINENFDYIYSRFTIHSIDEPSEDRVLNWVYSHLNPEGLFFVESRSINDSMYNRGKKLSENKNYTDHYRRYMDREKFESKLKKLGFNIVFSIESQGLSIYKNEDPYIVRIVAKKL